jgi:hypothetical protein
VDLDGDGKIDVLSGSYSRQEADMAGLLQVLKGTGKGTFSAASVLNGNDGKPLIIAADQENMTDKICTRAFAVDLDGDGHLDLVVGNFTGTFAFFRGDGKGGFETRHSWLMCGDEPLAVSNHGDPFFVDWDGDGVLDLVSGSAQGGVYLFRNEGTRKAPKFAKAVTLVEPSGYEGNNWGDAGLKGPQHATRVWVDDVDGDGVLDLLVGDAVTLLHPAKGLDEAAAKKAFAQWEKQREAALKDAGADDQKQAAVFQDMDKKRAAIVSEEMTGFVWLFRGKRAPTDGSAPGRR